jgi:hypothetical protein
MIEKIESDYIHFYSVNREMLRRRWDTPYTLALEWQYQDAYLCESDDMRWSDYSLQYTPRWPELCVLGRGMCETCQPMRIGMP